MKEKRNSTIREERANHSIGYVYDKFMEFRARQISTRKLYDYAFGLFVNFIGTDSIQINEIEGKTVAMFIKWLGENYSGNTGYVVLCIIKSIFNFADKQYYIDINPCNMVDSRCRLTRHHHHQALTDRQIAICENDFWQSFESSKNGEWERDMLTNFKSNAFFQMCFILGYYLQGLALADVLSLKVTQVKVRKTAGGTMYVIDTTRRKTGKCVKVVIPDTHSRRYKLFTIVYESAQNSGREHLLPIMDMLGNDELYIYNKVNRINCDLSRKLKQWWRNLNKTLLKHHPIDTKTTSYYSCRHTFATLYLQNPNASIYELATLMGRNTEYIDTYIREIESEKTISNASDKVFGRSKSQQEQAERKSILRNQRKIMEMQLLIMERIDKQIRG